MGQSASPVILGADDSEKAQLVGKAAVRAATHLGLPLSTLAAILDYPVSRIEAAGEGLRLLPNSVAFAKAVTFIRMYRSLDSLMGGDEYSARTWLTSRNTSLQARPVDLLATQDGFQNVINYLDSRRAIV